VEVNTNLRSALFWMNTYTELLGVDERALRRMRALGAGDSGPSEADVKILLTEIARVRGRLGYWEDLVDRANARLQRPAC